MVKSALLISSCSLALALLPLALLPFLGAGAIFLLIMPLSSMTALGGACLSLVLLHFLKKKNRFLPPTKRAVSAIVIASIQILFLVGAHFEPAADTEGGNALSPVGVGGNGGR